MPDHLPETPASTGTSNSEARKRDLAPPPSDREILNDIQRTVDQCERLLIRITQTLRDADHSTRWSRFVDRVLDWENWRFPK